MFDLIKIKIKMINKDIESDNMVENWSGLLKMEKWVNLKDGERERERRGEPQNA